MLRRLPCFEVAIATVAMSSLIDAVHSVALQAGGGRSRTWQHDNVIGIDTPLITDLEIAAALRRHEAQGRPIAAIGVVAQGHVAVDVIFGLREDLATALFTGLHDTNGPAADRESSLAEFLASTTISALAAEGVDSRLRQLSTG